MPYLEVIGKTATREAAMNTSKTALMNKEFEISIQIPGTVADYLASVMEGKREGDEGRAREALANGTYQRRGRAYSLTITADKAVTDVVSDYVGQLLSLSGAGEVSASEISGARVTEQRIREASEGFERGWAKGYAASFDPEWRFATRRR